MSFALALTFGGGGTSDSGPSGGVIVALIIGAAILVPVVIGLVLRMRDARRGDEPVGEETKLKDPPNSFSLSGTWGRDGGSDVRNNWIMVGALAVALAIYLVVSQL